MTGEQKLGALAILLGLGFGTLIVVGSQKLLVTKPVKLVTYPYHECVKVLTPEGEKPCSWLKESQPYNIEYAGNVTGTEILKAKPSPGGSHEAEQRSNHNA